jgi:hypothetical protein
VAKITFAMGAVGGGMVRVPLVPKEGGDGLVGTQYH